MLPKKDMADPGASLPRRPLHSAKFVVACALLWLALWLSQAPPACAQTAQPPYTTRQRFGINVLPVFGGAPSFPGALSGFPSIEALGFGWYSDWTVKRSPEQPPGIEFAQLLQTRPWPPNWSTLEEAVRANPGALWMIGNEPETRTQGEHTPSQYAAIYHQAYTFIKGIDPEAQIAIGGVVMPTPLRLEWLERCLEAYAQQYGQRMPIEVWNIHVQILQENRYSWGCGIPYGLEADYGRLYSVWDNASAPIFRQLVLEFCAWLVEQGERDKPLIISEYGVLMPSSYLPRGDASVLSFMQETFDFLLSERSTQLGWSADEDRLVQRWMWFSLNSPFYEETPGGYNGALYHWQTRELTIFGQFFRDYTRQHLGAHWAHLPLIWRMAP
jgi:hypothetical protein